MNILVPAIIPHSFEDLESYVVRAKQSVQFIQIDILDGVFVPALRSWPYTQWKSFEPLKNGEQGLPYWKDVEYEAHLMIRKPENSLLDWIQAGVSRIIVHPSSSDDVEGIVALCKEQEVDLCFAYTPCELRSYQRIDEIINRWAPHVSGFQVMGNDTIGYHGVELDIEVPSLIQRMRSMYDGDIAIDIGVQSSTWRSLIDAGANRLISGSLFFSVDDPTQLVEDIASYKAKV